MKSKWTNLTKADIAAELAKNGFKVSRNIVKKMLKIMTMSNANP